jgi:glycosyltransferase involved in cell wall biosynthesis
VDASRALRPIQTGTEAYSRCLIAALLRRPSARRYRLYADRPLGEVFPETDGYESAIIRRRYLWTHLGLRAELAHHRPDLLFVPSHVIPVRCPVPAVATIHDVGYLWHRSAYRPVAGILLHLGTWHNARVARRIVADSQATARDLVAHFGVAPERIRVAYLGGPEVPDARPGPETAARYGLPPRYFLFVGTLQPRKNLGRVLRAFARLSGAGDGAIVLALAGAAGHGSPELRRQVHELGLDQRVRWLGYVPRADLPALYAHATAFVFPSLYEGFGLPVVEAMAWGAPVITSSASSLPEVAGDAAILVDPYDVEGLARSMERVLADPGLRDDLIAAGHARARRFTWDRCAEEVEAVFDEVAGGP